MSKKRKFGSIDFSNETFNSLTFKPFTHKYSSTELAPSIIKAVEKNDILTLRTLCNNLKGSLQDLQTVGVIGEAAVKAAVFGNDDALCYFYKNWPAVNNYSNGSGLKIVHIATMHNQLSTLNTLSQLGFDLKILSADDSNALHYVNTDQIAGFLLDMGVNVHHKNKTYEAPIDIARAKNNLNLVRYLRQYYDPEINPEEYDENNSDDDSSLSYMSSSEEKDQPATVEGNQLQDKEQPEYNDEDQTSIVPWGINEFANQLRDTGINKDFTITPCVQQTGDVNSFFNSQNHD